MRDGKEYIIFDEAAPRAIASSTNASPIEVTMAAPHSFATGDKVSINGHLVNTNANGSFEVIVTGPTTLELVGTTGNGIGGATGTLFPRGKYVMCADYRDAVLAFDSDGDGDAAMTIKVVGSIQKTPPDFSAPQSKDNQYEFIQIVDIQNSVTIDGADGVVLAAEDVHRLFEVNVNGLLWVSAVLVGTQGEITLKARIFNNN